jgi:hypothetical protein
MEKTYEELYREREKRVNDAIQLKVPDRVPIAPIVGFFPAYYGGITPQEAMYDYNKTYAAWKKTCLDFQWDMIMPPRYANPGPVFELLDYRQLKWPGHGVDPNQSFQFVEGEYMKAEEYDEFLEDPSDFMIRTYFPRIFGILEPFKKLPPIHQTFAYCLGLFTNLSVMGTPEVANAIESLLKAARECLRWTVAMGPFPKEMAGLGFPAMYGSVAQAPFDTVGDYFRGTRGTMIDMFRRPDKLLEAIDKVTPWMIQMAISAGKASGNPRVFIPLHKGPENFMSLEQFKTFYWPGLRKIMIALIDQGLTPYLLLEGKWGSGRLEVISDIPKGKAIYHFEGVDIYEAKEILGKVVCIKGNVPTSLLVIGTPQEVKDYSKKLIDVLGKDGGFIMDAGAIIDEVKPQNIKAMTDCTKEYGVYH